MTIPIRRAEARRGVGRLGLVASLLALGWGCALPHRMERAAPVATACPEQQSHLLQQAPDSTRLQWYRATEERDRRLAAVWCSTVGAPVVELRPQPSREGWPEGELDVVTWNMNIGGGDLYRLLHEQLGLDCLAERPARSDAVAPFVLLLQEVWRYSADLPEVGRERHIPYTIDPDRETGEDPDVVEAARACGLALVYVPSARNGPDDGTRPKEDKGNAILSNVPLSTPIAIDLPLEGGRKVAVAANVAAPSGERLRVVSAHLDVMSTLVRIFMSGNQTRVRQTMGLVEGLAAAERDGLTVDATVVGADMNTWAGNESTLKRMWAEFPESPTWDELGTRGGFPTDHLFFRSAASSVLAVDGYERIEDPYSSDHRARRVRVTDRAVE